jgi:hypothetical protein
MSVIQDYDVELPLPRNPIGAVTVIRERGIRTTTGAFPSSVFRASSAGPSASMVVG